MAKTKTYRRAGNMCCPVCQDILVPGETARYETLGEHVSNPNAIPSLKQGYVCENKNCIVHDKGLSWLEDGEGPFGNSLSIPRYLFNESVPVPRGTFWYYQELCEIREDRWTYRIPVPGGRLDVRLYHFDIRYLKRADHGALYWHWSLCVWWRTRVAHRKYYKELYYKEKERLELSL